MKPSSLVTGALILATTAAWSGAAFGMDPQDGGVPPGDAGPPPPPPPPPFDHGAGSCPLYTGGGFPVDGPTQKGNIAPTNGNDASRCGVSSPPVVVRDTGSRFHYRLLHFKNRSLETACITVSLNLFVGHAFGDYFRGGAIQAAAYLAPFDPEDVAKGLLGDVREVMYARPEYPYATENVLRGFSFEVPSLAEFDVVVNEAPEATGPSTYDLSVKGCGTHVITSVTPSSGPTAGGTLVTIKGSGFDGNNDPPFVSIGSDVRDVKVLDEATMTVVTNATAAGTYDVKMTNRATGEWRNTVVLPSAYTYVEGAAGAGASGGAPTAVAAPGSTPPAAGTPVGASPMRGSDGASTDGDRAAAGACSAGRSAPSGLVVVGLGLIGIAAVRRRAQKGSKQS